MEVTIGKVRYRVYAMDFETHADEESKRLKETGVWLSSIIDETSKLEDESNFDYSIEGVIGHLRRLAKDGPILVYVWNLSFEWSFLLPALLQMGVKWKALFEKGDEMVFNSTSTKTATSVWQARVKFSKDEGDIAFRDLAKIFPGGLRNVAHDMALPTQKGDIDFTINRRHNYQVTAAEKEYNFKDTRIVIDILERMKGDQSFWDSVSMSGYACSTMIREGYSRARFPYRYFRSKNQYPELGKEESDFMRHLAHGGISYVQPQFQFAEIKHDIIHIDAHQMHPSSAYLNLFPYGYGTYGRGEPPMFGNKLWALHVKISYSSVKIHSLVQTIGIPIVTDFETYLWNFELDLARKAYNDLRVKFIDYYEYPARLLPWRHFYKENYEQRTQYKKDDLLFLAQLCKLKNNGSYGKLLEKGHPYERENVIDEKGLIDSIDHPKEEAPINARYTYLPVGTAIPAYSRVCLVRTALSLGWKNCIYFDTDSIFFLDNEETRKAMKHIDFENHLGGWGLEGRMSYGQFTAPKRYKGTEDGLDFVKSAGFQIPLYKLVERERKQEDILPTRAGVRDDPEEKVAVPLDEINIVSNTYYVKRAYRVRGGTMVDYQKKEMKVQEKYMEIYNKNKGKVID